MSEHTSPKIEYELGSEFELDPAVLRPVQDSVYSYLSGFQTIYTTSGRAALRLLRSILPEGKLLMPSYLCESVTDEFPSSSVTFYPVGEDLLADTDVVRSLLSTGKYRYFYLMHYFGDLQSRALAELLLEYKQKQDLIIIEDTTHSIFTAPQTIGDYCICSLRKWFPVPDGGVLYTKTGSLRGAAPVPYPCPIPPRLEPMLLKKAFLRDGIDCDPLYRRKFAKAEAALDASTAAEELSSLSGQILDCLSVDQMILRRRENYRFLKQWAEDHPSPLLRPLLEGRNITPLSYPVLVTDLSAEAPDSDPSSLRDRLRAFLSDRRIYCAVHWPIRYHIPDERLDTQAKSLSNRILSLPLDQRYGEDAIRYLTDTLAQFFDETRRSS